MYHNQMVKSSKVNQLSIMLQGRTRQHSDRECVSTGAAGAPTRRSMEHHLLHPQIQIPNAYPVLDMVKQTSIQKVLGKEP